VILNPVPPPPTPARQQPDCLLNINVRVDETREEDVLSPLTAAASIICNRQEPALGMEGECLLLDRRERRGYKTELIYH
jgi:hypothetical protein